MPQSAPRVPRLRTPSRVRVAARPAVPLRLALALLMILGLAATLPGLARAQDSVAQDSVAPALAERMQAIIAAQIDAFRKDDAEAAYAFAAPSIRMRFPDPARFVSMVQEGYPAVYRPRSFTFEGTAMTPRGPVQRVEFVGLDGQVWAGLYTFLEAEDGALSISGVFLRREAERAI